MNDSVHYRNAKALAEGAKADRAKHDELHARVRSLEAQHAMLRIQFEQVRQMALLALASRGSGPTVTR